MSKIKLLPEVIQIGVGNLSDFKNIIKAYQDTNHPKKILAKIELLPVFDKVKPRPKKPELWDALLYFYDS